LGSSNTGILFIKQHFTGRYEAVSPRKPHNGFQKERIFFIESFGREMRKTISLLFFRTPACNA
jgi:hypothetical protein